MNTPANFDNSSFLDAPKNWKYLNQSQILSHIKTKFERLGKLKLTFARFIIF